MLIGGLAPAWAEPRAPEPIAVAARAPVPLPRPRPSVSGNAGPAAGEATGGAEVPAAADRPSAPSACRLALTDAVAVAPSLPPVQGPGECGGDDLVRLEAIVLSDRRRVTVKPAATLRCQMAMAVAQWVRTDVAALAAGLGTTVSELDNFDSFECRGRNRVVGAKLSEHGRANALDVRSIRLANGQSLALTDRNVSREAREKVMASVCARFTTVLGPGSDGYHEDHIHLDLRERRNGYRICQWNLDGAPIEVATPLPPPRPEGAPPREVASRDAQKEPAQVEEVKVQPASPPASLSLSPVPLARQPADVAKPKSAGTQAAAKGVKSAARDAAKPLQIAPEGAKPPGAGASETKSSEAKPSETKSTAARRPASKPRPQRRASAASRQRPPDLPRLLRQMFD